MIFVKKKDLLIISGSAIFYSKDRENWEEAEFKDFDFNILKGKRVKFLIGLPYFKTYIQETIILNKSELKSLSLRLFSIKKNSSDWQMISSVAQDKKKAVTIHSQLTTKGKKLILKLKHKKLNFKISPLILETVSNFKPNTFFGTKLEEEKKLRIIFPTEVLNILFQNQQLKIINISIPSQFNQNYSLIKNYLDYALYKNSIPEHNFLLSIFSQKIAENNNLHFDQTLPAKLFLNKQHLKVVHWKKVKKINLPRLKLSIFPVILSLTALIIIWGIIRSVEITNIKNKVAHLHQNTSQLENKILILSPVIKNKKKLFKLESLIESVNHYQVSPKIILGLIDKILPENSWVSRVDINYYSLKIQLNTSDNISSSNFREIISQIFTAQEINLLSTKDFLLGSKNCKEYTFNLKNFKLKIKNEKLLSE